MCISALAGHTLRKQGWEAALSMMVGEWTCSRHNLQCSFRQTVLQSRTLQKINTGRCRQGLWGGVVSCTEEIIKQDPGISVQGMEYMFKMLMRHQNTTPRFVMLTDRIVHLWKVVTVFHLRLWRFALHNHPPRASRYLSEFMKQHIQVLLLN